MILYLDFALQLTTNLAPFKDTHVRFVRLHSILSERFCIRKLLLVRIHLLAIYPEAVTHVRPGGQSCRTYVANDISLLDFNVVLNAFLDFAHMQVLCGVRTVMTHLYIVAVGPGIFGRNDDPIRSGHNGRTRWGSIIRTQVRLPSFLYDGNAGRCTVKIFS